MADQLKDFAEIPRDFLKDGTQFLNRCTKRTSSQDISACPISDRLSLPPVNPAPQFGDVTQSRKQRPQRPQRADIDPLRSRQAGIPQDLSGRRRRLPRHGRHWLRCEAEYVSRILPVVDSTEIDCISSSLSSGREGSKRDISSESTCKEDSGMAWHSMV